MFNELRKTSDFIRSSKCSIIIWDAVFLSPLTKPASTLRSYPHMHQCFFLNTAFYIYFIFIVHISFTHKLLKKLFRDSISVFNMSVCRTTSQSALLSSLIDVKPSCVCAVWMRISSQSTVALNVAIHNFYMYSLKTNTPRTHIPLPRSSERGNLCGQDSFENTMAEKDRQ